MPACKEGEIMGEKFERHRQPWTSDEIQKLHRLAGKGMSLKAISKALTRSEESIQASTSISLMNRRRRRVFWTGSRKALESLGVSC